jgi:hypothetical protein
MRSSMMAFVQLCGLATSLTLSLASPAAAQQGPPASPAGSAATQVGGEWVTNDRGRSVYEGGKWIEITYGRPILRQREGIFGAGDTYGKQILAGAPVWRLGANVSTRLSSETDLIIGGTRVPAGEYSLFVDLKGPQDWSLIVSSWGAQQSYNPNDKESLWGAYGYTSDKDVARAPVKVEQLARRADQLTISFVDVTKSGGTIAVWWDDVLATVPFEVAP